MNIKTFKRFFIFFMLQIFNRKNNCWRFWGCV